MALLRVLLRSLRARLFLLAVCMACAVAGPVAVAGVGRAIAHAAGVGLAARTGGDLAVIAQRRLSASEAAAVARIAGPSQIDTAALLTIARGVTIARGAAVSGTANAGTAGDGKSNLRTTVELRAVGSGFPLIGQWTGVDLQRLSREPCVYVQPQVLSRLELQIGDHLRLGRSEVVIAGVVQEGPLVGGAFALGPTVLIGMQHIEATGLVAAGARVRWARWFTSTTPRMLRDSLRPALGAAAADVPEQGGVSGDQVRVLQAEQIISGSLRVLDGLGEIIAVAAALSATVGGIGAVVLGRLTGLACMADLRLARCLGATPGETARAVGLALVLTGSVGGIIGVVLGGQGGQILMGLIALKGSAWPPPLYAALAVLLAVVVAGAAAWPAVRVAVLGPPGLPSRHVGARSTVMVIAVIGALAAVIGLRPHSSGTGLASTPALAVAAVVGLSAGLWVIAVGATWLAGLIGRGLPLAGWAGPLGWALRGLHRPDTDVPLISVGLGAIAASVTAVWCLRTTIVHEVNPGEGSPGLFLIDIQSDQMEVVARALTAASATATFRPVVVARYSPATSAAAPTDQQSVFFRTREQRLSWREAASDGDRTTVGRWISAPGEASLEAGFARRLGVGIGSQLAFIASDGESISATVVGLRQVRWSSFRPNFFIYLHRNDLVERPTTWIAAAPSVPADKAEMLADELRSAAPNVSVIDVGDAVRTALDLTERMARGLMIVVAAATGAAVAVMLGLGLATAPRRRADAELLHRLGAPPALAARAAACEWFLAAALATFAASAVGAGIAYVVAISAELTPAWPPMLALLPVAAGALGVLTGWLAVRWSR